MLFYAAPKCVIYENFHTRMNLHFPFLRKYFIFTDINLSSSEMRIKQRRVYVKFARFPQVAAANVNLDLHNLPVREKLY